MSYIQYNVNISKGQEDKLQNAIRLKKAVSIRLSNHDLIGNHMLLLTQAQINNIKKAKSGIKELLSNYLESKSRQI